MYKQTNNKCKEECSAFPFILLEKGYECGPCPDNDALTCLTVNVSTDTFQAHVENANRAGCSLASILSREEQDVVNELSTINPFGVAFLGGRRIGMNATDGGPTGWEWLDGSSWDYTNWADGEPDTLARMALVASATDLDLAWRDSGTSFPSAGIYKCPDEDGPQTPPDTRVCP